LLQWGPPVRDVSSAPGPPVGRRCPPGGHAASAVLFTTGVRPGPVEAAPLSELSVALDPKPPRRCCPEHRAAARTAIPNAARGAFDFTVAASSSSARASRASTPPPRGCVPRSLTYGTRSPPPAWGHPPPCARGSSRERLPPRLASFSSSCSTPRSATDAALAIPSAPLRQARPSRLDAGPSALRRRLCASVSASGAAHHLLSRQCPGVRLDAAPSSHCQGRAALCRHQAATTLQKGVRHRRRVCPAGAPAPLPSLPLPRARCSRQCPNHELHQSRPPIAHCYAPKVISLGSVHFRSFGLWHVGSHSPFRC
jgi:hypothetical protein